MKITDIKYAMLDANPTIRITTDEETDGLAQIETMKPYLEPVIGFYKNRIIGTDPRDVARVMARIRNLGSFKPWGSVVSAIEMALWDLAGKAQGVPVYRLLGGKVRDKVRCYCGGAGPQMEGYEPEDYAKRAEAVLALPHGFDIMKFGLGLYIFAEKPDGMFLGEVPEMIPGPHTHIGGGFKPIRGQLTERGLNHLVRCVEAAKNAVGDKCGIAFDCGPKHTLISAMRLARALEPFSVMWLEDTLTGDYTPYNAVEAYRLLSDSTLTPIHTGEQVYLRQGFQELIERHAVDIVGPDPCDVGGIAELKWIAEYAALHDIMMAPHGVYNGPIGIASLVHVGATMPEENYLAFELPRLTPLSEELVKGLPKPLVRQSCIQVWDRPGLGVELNEQAVRRHLGEKAEAFLA